MVVEQHEAKRLLVGFEAVLNLSKLAEGLH